MGTSTAQSILTTPLQHPQAGVTTGPRPLIAMRQTPTGADPSHPWASGQARGASAAEVLMRPIIKCWSRRCPSASLSWDTGDDTGPANPPASQSRKREAREQKTPKTAVFFTKYTKFKPVRIIYKRRKIQNVRNCPVCTRIEKCPVLEQGPAREATGPHGVSPPSRVPSPDILRPRRFSCAGNGCGYWGPAGGEDLGL